MKELDIDKIIKDTPSKAKTFCGVKYSTCNKNIRFKEHSLCCLKCEYSCSNCTVTKVSECDELCSKEEVILNTVEELSKEKDKFLRFIKDIDDEIKELNNLM